MITFAMVLAGAFVLFDTFDRPDGPIDGTAAPSGHVYETNVPDGQAVRDGRYVSDAVAGAKIAYLTLEEKPSAIAAEFIFTGGEDFHENAVIGSAEQGFGLGSVQLAVWRNHWRLFIVQSPIVDPYPTILAGAFDRMLEPNRPYRMAMHFDAGNSAVTIEAPDGSRHTVTHPILSRYWGHRIGMQMRHPTTESGFVEFLSLTACAL